MTDVPVGQRRGDEGTVGEALGAGHHDTGVEGAREGLDGELGGEGRRGGGHGGYSRRSSEGR